MGWTWTYVKSLWKKKNFKEKEKEMIKYQSFKDPYRFYNNLVVLNIILLILLSSPFRSLYIEKIFKFGHIDGFFLKCTLNMFNFLNNWSSLLYFFNPDLNMIIILIDLILDIVQILNNIFALLCHFLNPFYNCRLLLKIQLFKIK